MKEKKVTPKKRFERDFKTEAFIKKTLLVLIVFYLMYQAGYVVGTLLSNIGL